MSKYKYIGEDAELPRLGRVGHGSIIDILGNEIEAIGGTKLERVGEKEAENILPYGTIPFVPDVTGLTQAESEEATANANRVNTGLIDPEQEAKRIKAEEDRREIALGRREFKAPVITLSSLTPEQIIDGRKRGLSPEQVVAEQKELQKQSIEADAAVRKAREQQLAKAKVKQDADKSKIEAQRKAEAKTEVKH